VSINRFNPRTDAVQGPIVRALEAIGAKVYYIKLPLDLLVGWRNRNVLLECKGWKARLTKDQEEFFATWPGEKHLVHSPEEALTAILGKQAMR